MKMAKIGESLCVQLAHGVTELGEPCSSHSSLRRGPAIVSTAEICQYELSERQLAF
jgi:hypothetical protein